MANESLVIYSMNKVGRIAHSAPNKQILRDRAASLGFYYGATFGRRARSQRRGPSSNDPFVL